MRPTFAEKAALTKPKLRPRFPPLSVPSRQVGVKDGKPAISFSGAEVRACEKRFAFSLVAKFTVGRPTLGEIRKAFQTNWVIAGRTSSSEI